MCCGKSKNANGTRAAVKWRVTVPSDPKLSKDFPDRGAARAYAVSLDVPTTTKAVQTREKV